MATDLEIFCPDHGSGDGLELTEFDPEPLADVGTVRPFDPTSRVGDVLDRHLDTLRARLPQAHGAGTQRYSFGRT